MRYVIFSPKETAILAIIGDRKLKTLEIAEELYGRKKRPLSWRNIVGPTIGRINEKCKYHKLNWCIDGEGLGRDGKTVWKDKREPKN